MVSLIGHRCRLVARAVGGWRGSVFVLWVMAAVVVFNAWLGFWEWLEQKLQPASYHVVLSVGTTQTEYAAGEDPVTKISVARQRPPDCTLTIFRHVADLKTGVIVFSQMAPGIAENTRPDRPIEYKRVIHNASLTPGRCYTYFFDAVDNCPRSGSPPPVRSGHSPPFCIKAPVSPERALESSSSPPAAPPP